MSDRELVLIIFIGLLLFAALYQMVQIWRLHRSIDYFAIDLDAEQLLRIAENTINRKLHEEELEEKNKRIALLEKALAGSEKARKELAVKNWEDANA